MRTLFMPSGVVISPDDMRSSMSLSSFSVSPPSKVATRTHMVRPPWSMLPGANLLHWASPRTAIGYGRHCAIGVCSETSPAGTPRSIRARTGDWKVPAFEVVLRRPNRKDRIRYWNRPDAQVGDIVEVDGRPWVVVQKEPPFELRRMERLICVPRLVRSMH